jgi:hypothetical protein
LVLFMAYTGWLDGPIRAHDPDWPATVAGDQIRSVQESQAFNWGGPILSQSPPAKLAPIPLHGSSHCGRGWKCLW